MFVASWQTWKSSCLQHTQLEMSGLIHTFVWLRWTRDCAWPSLKKGHKSDGVLLCILFALLLFGLSSCDSLRGFESSIQRRLRSWSVEASNKTMTSWTSASGRKLTVPKRPPKCSNMFKLGHPGSLISCSCSNCCSWSVFNLRLSPRSGSSTAFHWSLESYLKRQAAKVIK